MLLLKVTNFAVEKPSVGNAIETVNEALLGYASLACRARQPGRFQLQSNLFHQRSFPSFPVGRGDLPIERFSPAVTARAFKGTIVRIMVHLFGKIEIESSGPVWW